MKKGILVFLILFIIAVITSCNFKSETRILNKLDKHLSQYTGYNSELEMTIYLDGSESKYKMRERNTLNDNYSLEILEPKDSSGIIVEFDGEKVHIKHASIQQSVTLNPVKKFDESLLIGKFFRNPQKLLDIKEEELSDSKYYIFRNKISNRNRYSREQVIYLNKKDFKPYMLNIVDNNGEVRVSIKYIKFQFTNDK